MITNIAASLVLAFVIGGASKPIVATKSTHAKATVSCSVCPNKSAHQTASKKLMASDGCDNCAPECMATCAAMGCSLGSSCEACAGK